MIHKTPHIKEMESQTVAYVSFKGNYMGNTEIFKGLFDTLCGWAGPQQLLNENTKFLSAYQDDPNTTPPEEMVLQVCMIIQESQEVKGDIKKKTLPGGTYVVMNAELDGPSEYKDAWMKVVEWMQENKVEIDMSRPSYEYYKNNPEEHPQKHHIIDICMSAKK